MEVTGAAATSYLKRRL